MGSTYHLLGISSAGAVHHCGEAMLRRPRLRGPLTPSEPCRRLMHEERRVRYVEVKGRLNKHGRCTAAPKSPPPPQRFATMSNVPHIKATSEAARKKVLGHVVVGPYSARAVASDPEKLKKQPLVVAPELAEDDEAPPPEVGQDAQTGPEMVGAEDPAADSAAKKRSMMDRMLGRKKRPVKPKKKKPNRKPIKPKKRLKDMTPRERAKWEDRKAKDLAEIQQEKDDWKREREDEKRQAIEEKRQKAEEARQKKEEEKQQKQDEKRQKVEEANAKKEEQKRQKLSLIHI